VAIGVGALTVATILPLILPLGGAFLLRRRRDGLVCVAACLLVVSCSALANLARSGHWVAISSNGGLNLWIGNSPDSEEKIAVRPGHHWWKLIEHGQTNGANTPEEAGANLSREVLSWCRSSPAACLGNFAHKARLLLASRELPRNEDLYVVRKQAPMLWALTGTWAGAALPYVILLPLGAAGMVTAWLRRRGPLGLVLLTALILGSTPVIFFVTGRYRAPLAPSLAVLAAVGLEALVSRGKGFVVSAVLAAITLGFAVWPIHVATDKVNFEADMYAFIASEKVQAGEEAGAIADFEHALSLEPGYSDASLELGRLLFRLHRVPESVKVLRSAVPYHPDDLFLSITLGLTLLQSGDPAGAREPFELVLAKDPKQGDSLVGMGWVSLKAGDRAKAREFLERAQAVMGKHSLVEQLRQGLEQ
jgi:tetratricopeptide (TPR) repeat protein